MVPQVKATLQELADFIQWKQLKLPGNWYILLKLNVVHIKIYIFIDYL